MISGHARVSTLEQNEVLQTDALTKAGCDRLFERYLIRERTQAGLTAARSRSRKGGRPVMLTTRQQARIRKLY